ncbi:MAG: cytochrome P450 [SAR86 cluster bacterium]|nr:cytochrome P450 [SAR86 cluster bacterium]
MKINYNPYSKEFWNDPWTIYKLMRDEDPVHRMDDFGGTWALSRFEDIWNAHLGSYKDYTSVEGTSPPPLLLGEDSGPGSVSIPSNDGADHRDYRNTIADRYTQSSIAELEDKIRVLTQEELKASLKLGKLDIHEIARKVALFSITDMIGLERKTALQARELIDIFYERDPEIMGVTPRGQEAFGQCMGLMLQLAAEWREDTPPSPSHINAWINKQVREDLWMSDEQIMGNTSMLIITGADTVPYNIANLFYYLNQDPNQLEILRNDFSLIPNAFEECVRYDHPTNILGRKLNKDIELHGKEMKKGDSVIYLYQSAGRDEREFDNPDKFDVTRPIPKRSVNFGHGPHKCLGQHLAKLEGRVIIEEILSAIPKFKLIEEEVERTFSEFLQGYRHVPIEFDPS